MCKYGIVSVYWLFLKDVEVVGVIVMCDESEEVRVMEVVMVVMEKG